MVADFIVKVVQTEREQEERYGLPYQSLEGLVTIYGTIEKAKRNIAKPRVQAIFTDPEAQLAVVIRPQKTRNTLFTYVQSDFVFPTFK